MKKVYFKTNAIVKKYGCCQKQSKKNDMEEVGFGGWFGKVWAKGKEPQKNMAIGVAIGVAFLGIHHLFDDLLNKFKSKTRKDETTHNTNEKIRETKARCQAEAEKYDRKIEADIKEMKARHELHENVQEESSNEPEETQRDEETLSSSECKVSDLLKKRQNAPEVPDLISGIIRPGDVHILAGKSGLGKSFYALAFAYKFSSGRPATIIPSDVECKPIKVYYYDGELEDEEFIRRCQGNTPDAYSNIVRIGHPGFNSIDAFMNDVEQKVLIESSDVAVIVDNMDSMFEDLNKKTANQLRSRIESIQAKCPFKLTFVLVGHPTKDYDEFAEMQTKHISGSSSFTNMASSISIIAPTRFGEGYSMLRVLKYRNGKKNSEKVFISRMVDEPYPHPEYDRVELLNDALPLKAKASKESKSNGNEPGSGEKGFNGKFTQEEELAVLSMYEETKEKNGKSSSRKAAEAFKKKHKKSISHKQVMNIVNKYRPEKAKEAQLRP